ncbi:MAG: hypothetical protein PHG11_05735 [Eubacteriales bacterium]|jgi:hypothetical protein|nr:hypothetical protein [Eubacteriales bacterium]NLO12987.1 hypothetical protein [Clostridiales bacterium]
MVREAQAAEAALDGGFDIFPVAALGVFAAGGVGVVIGADGALPPWFLCTPWYQKAPRSAMTAMHRLVAGTYMAECDGG